FTFDSWHVRNKDNIQRVRRDEEKAAAEEKEKQRRIALAEQEARTEFLRKKSRKSLPSSTQSSAPSSITEDSKDTIGPQPASEDNKYDALSLSSDLQSGSRGFINFFKAEEEDTASSVSVKKNIDHEAERKVEKEEWEKKVGILTYLGQNSTEMTGMLYLYFCIKIPLCGKAQEIKHRKLQDSLDPMNKMTKYLEMKSSSKDKHHKDKHKHKKKHKHKDKVKDKEKKSKPSKTIEELRAERMRREGEERRRASALMARARGEKCEETVIEPEVTERERKYNSQYNPDFVRKPKKR
ncbi:hypothetical protein FSP39_010501, partial [Pinctada imbricata]